MTIDNWIVLWKWIFLVGLVSFFVLVVVIIPLGWRDLVRLFARLRAGGDRSVESDDANKP